MYNILYTVIANSSEYTIVYIQNQIYNGIHTVIAYSILNIVAYIQ